jgi:peptide/nickel transport system substrate-binding protein
MKYLKYVLFVLMVSMLVLSACTPKATETTGTTTTEAAPVTEASKTLVIAMNIDDLITLDPAIASESTNQFIHANVYDTLIVFDPAHLDQPIANLAESWEANTEATEFTFHLRQGVKFSTGNPLTAKDVVFTWMRSKYMLNWMFNIVDSVTAVDDYTVKIVLNTPTADFYGMVSHPGWGIMDSVALAEHGGVAVEGADQTDTAKLWLDQNSIGTAAYILTGWAPKSQVTLDVNPNYWGTAPYFEKVIVKHVEDPTAMMQMLQKGDADIVPSVDIDLADMAKSDPNLQVLINQSEDTYYLAMTFNCTTEVSPDTAALLCQQPVRQAIYYSIDFDGLIQAILKGYAVHAPALLPIGMSVMPALTSPTRDIEKAKQLLADAGYPDGITIDFTYNSNPQRDTIAAKLQADMAEAGITANLVPMEATVYLDQMRAQKLPIGFGGWTPDYLDRTLWTDNYSCPDTGIAFRMWYDNPAACDLAHKIKSELDPAARDQETLDLQNIWLTDMNFFNLYQPQYITALDKDIKGYIYHPARMVNLALLSR